MSPVAVLAWFSPARWLMLLGLIAALTLGYFAWVDRIGDKREAQVVARYDKQAKDADAQRAAVAAPIVEKQIVVQEKIRTVFKTITKEVPIYVQATDPPMSGGFRVLHDAAANGILPDASRIAHAAPAPAQTVAATVAGNYEACLANAADLTLLQEWVAKQKQLK